MNLKRLLVSMVLFCVVLFVTGGVTCSAGNVLTAPGQWVCDTAADLSTKGTDHEIQSIVWFPAAADNDLLLTNFGGTVVIVKARALCAATNGEFFCRMEWNAADLPNKIKGLDLVTIDGGVLYINFKNMGR